jgi:hypothetical protein
MFLKKKRYLLSLLLSLFFLNACLPETEWDEVNLMDAEIIFLSLSNTSNPEFLATKFTIDQFQGKIYNKDSMSYGTSTEEKVIIDFASGNEVSSLILLGEKDTISVVSGDSLDVSQPLKFRVYALDGITTKDYSFQVNIHQVNPDSMQYIKIDSNRDFIRSNNQQTVYFKSTFFTYVKNDTEIELYSSTDVINWNKESLSGLPDNAVIRNILCDEHTVYSRTEDGCLYVSYDAKSWEKIETEYPVVDMLGYLNSSPLQDAGLCTMVAKEGTLIFAFTSNLTDWAYGNTVPEAFPLSGYSNFNREISKLQYLFVAGGRTSSNELINAVWSTQNGLHWAKTTDDRFSNFPYVTNANAFVYNEKFNLFNGEFGGGYHNQSFSISENNGYTWDWIDVEYWPNPEIYEPRSQATLIVDDDGIYFYIFGGHKEGMWRDVWKGFLNKQAFGR